MVRGNREEEILEVAVRIFSEKGFSAATTSEIAKEAGIAEGTIFRYFKTKKEILAKVMVKLVQIIGERIMTVRLVELFEKNKHLSEEEVLKLVMKDRISVAVKYFDMIKVVVTEIQYHEDLRQAFISNIIIKGKDIVSKYFKEGIEKGIFKDIDVNIAVRSMVGMVGMYVLQRQLLPELVPIEDDKQLDMMIELFLHGLSNRNEPYVDAGFN